jgi:multidrug efflux system membrane fusion protein
MQIKVHKPKRWLMSIPVLLGLAVFVLLLKTREPPQQAAPQERARPVRVIKVPRVNLIPRVRAYGTVAPGKVWEAVTQVSGKVVEMHPRLEVGEFLGQGAELLRIEPKDYELAITQIESDIQATSAQLAENRIKEKNIREALVIEKESLRLSRKELERKRRLVTQGTIPQSEVDKEERTVLAQKQSVTSQVNALNLLPAERQLLNAQLQRYKAQLAAAELDLERTFIRLPFDARVSQVNIERNQYVRTGDVLIVADDIGVAEIVAQIPMQRFRNVIMTRQEPVERLMDLEISKFFGVSARVRLPEFDIEWPARLSRMSPTIDPKTRTIGAIVEVDEPYRQAKLGIRPPLVKELFVEVVLSGRQRPDSLVMPRTALHNGRVYVVGAENRLKIRPVELGLIQPEFVGIKDGVAEDDRVVISDLIPAIENMLLNPQNDDEALSRLVHLAEGKS